MFLSYKDFKFVFKKNICDISIFETMATVIYL